LYGLVAKMSSRGRCIAEERRVVHCLLTRLLRWTRRRGRGRRLLLGSVDGIVGVNGLGTRRRGVDFFEVQGGDAGLDALRLQLSLSHGGSGDRWSQLWGRMIPG
jgi:hypothetical protein